MLVHQYSYDNAGKHTEDNNGEKMISYGDNFVWIKVLRFLMTFSKLKIFFEEAGFRCQKRKVMKNL